MLHFQTIVVDQVDREMALEQLPLRANSKWDVHGDKLTSPNGRPQS